MTLGAQSRLGLLAAAALACSSLLVTGTSAAAGSVGAGRSWMPPRVTRDTAIGLATRRVFLARLRCSNWLGSVETTSKSDAWATGGVDSSAPRCQPARAFAVHWNGHAWSIVHFPDPTFVATSVHASSRRNVWFFGWGRTAEEALRWDGSSWHVMTIPQNLDLWRPVVLGPADVWMSDSSSWTGAGWQTPLWHWDGTMWTEHDLPVLADDLFSIAGATGRHPWAVGIRAATASSTATGRLAAYRWDGTAWRPQPVPPVWLTGPAEVAESASGVVWITGYRPPRRGGHGRGEPIVLYRVRGTWKQLPDRVMDLAVLGIGSPAPDGFNGADLNGLYWSGRTGIGLNIFPIGFRCRFGFTNTTNGTSVAGIPGTRSFLTVGGCQLNQNVNGKFESDISITTPR
jgi:hypothetical protein